MKKSTLLFALLILLLNACKQDEPAPKPVASFSVTYKPDGVVSFDNTSTSATSYQWTFGDGQTSTLQHPSVKYASNSTYNVTLTAKSQHGENTTTKTVDIRTIYVPTTGNVIFWSSSSYSIKIYVNGLYKGTSTKYITNGVSPSCGLDGFITVNLPQGAYSFTAEEDRLIGASKWAGTINVVNGKCSTMQLTK